MLRFKSLMAGLALVVGLSTAVWATQHHDGMAKLKNKGDGKHVVHTTSHGHTAVAHVQGGKVTKVTVTQKGKSVPVKTFKKTAKNLPKQAFALPEKALSLAEMDAVVDVRVAPPGLEELCQVGGLPQTSFIGFGFFNQATGQWEIIWFPANMVMGAPGTMPPAPTPPGPIPPGPVPPGPVPPGQNQVSSLPLITTGNCPPGGSTSYSIQATAGFFYTCLVTSQTPGYIPLLQVFDSSGIAVGASSNFGSPGMIGNGAVQQLQVPTTGVYRIQVGAKDPNHTGNFSLSVQ
jgi:hypothetical protein